MFNTFVCMVLIIFLFCLKSDTPQLPFETIGALPEPSNFDELWDSVDNFEVSSDIPDAAQNADSLELVTVLDISQPEDTNVELDEAPSANGYIWKDYNDVSTTALRRSAKELGVPRYSRLDRSELVFELNVRLGNLSAV